MKKTLKIKGMHCPSCEILLKESIEETGTKVLSASHTKGEIVVDLKNESAMPTVKKAIEKEGYTLA